MQKIYAGLVVNKGRHAMRYLVVLLLAGCGAIQVHPDAGRYFTIEHGTARFGDAMEGARQHCARMGLSARHLGTDVAYMAMSRFECVK
jgi:hypothetical protein